MGRGRSGASGGWVAARSVTSTGGDTIDLSGSPLRYGGTIDISAGAKQAAEDFEAVRWKNKIEYNRAVDANGNIIEERRGGKGSVKSTVKAMNAADVFTHNHPRSGGEDGFLGGTFSVQDLNNWSTYGVRVYRATAAEGTYSIAKKPGFDGRAFRQYYSSEAKNAMAKERATIRPYEKTYLDTVREYKKGNADYSEVKRTYAEYKDAAVKAGNQQLVDLHNALIDGQKKYGYSYALERR